MTQEKESLPIIDSPTIYLTKQLLPDKFYYHLRLTDSKTTKQIIADGLAHMSDRYIVSEEQSSSKVLHFHCFIESDIPYAKKEQKAFYTKVKENIDLPKGQFSTSAMKSENLISYVLKDGDYISKGFDLSFLKSFAKKSYAKYDKKEFATKQHELEELYLTDKLSRQRFMTEFITLKVRHKQIINRNWLKQYFTMMIMKRTPSEIKKYVDILDDSIASDFIGIIPPNNF